MKLLLVETTPGNAHQVATWLQEAGHETSTCFSTPVNFGCRGVANHQDCPLERETDAAVLVSDFDGSGHTLTEMGAVCAMRRRVPVLRIVEPGTPDLDATMLALLDDLQRYSAHPDYVLAAQEALTHIAGIGDVSRIGVAITRDRGRVHAMLNLPPELTDAQVPTIVDFVGRALREYDHYAKVIDVGVRRV